MEAQETYESLASEIEERLAALATALGTHAERAAGTPERWTWSGDLARAMEHLEQALVAVGGMEAQ